MTSSSLISLKDQQAHQSTRNNKRNMNINSASSNLITQSQISTDLNYHKEQELDSSVIPT